jgi:hypothetical protein
LLVSGFPKRAECQTSRQDGPPAALARQNERFLAAVRAVATPRELVGFFPKRGEITYRHSVHSDSGTTIRVRSFPAAGIPAALEDSLWAVFTVQIEAQPIGLFAHQLALRGPDWVYIGRHRFAPPGSNSCTPIYVEWRLEDGRWVISAVADESFSDALPGWCC